MSGPIEIENAASRLRHDLRHAQLPELKLLCSLKFFTMLFREKAKSIESYLHEFLPFLTEASSQSKAHEFLPEEGESLSQFIDNLKILHSSVVGSNDLEILEKLNRSIKSADRFGELFGLEKKNTVSLLCLFVEYYPDLELSPRGRILKLNVFASRIPESAEKDDVVVRNPVFEQDDRFFQQARDSVKASRLHLKEHCGLSLNRRYRFDFSIESTGARFTGDSLGLAFAVGAIAAVEKIEIFHERLRIAHDVAFSGALSAEGALTSINSEGLKVKIFRALHSDIKYLVIPREHISPAWDYVKELENRYPGEKLDLIRADRLDDVLGDSRLVEKKRLSAAGYWGRRALRYKRIVEVPAFLILLYVLLSLIYPKAWLWFDRNPSYTQIDNELTNLLVFNSRGQELWQKHFPCKLYPVSTSCLYDLNNDGKNEILHIISTDEDYNERGKVICYSHKGEVMFERNGFIETEITKAYSKKLLNPLNLEVCEIGDNPVIVAVMGQDRPPLCFISLWTAEGKPIGWFINCGHGRLELAKDFNGDGVKELVFFLFGNCLHRATMLVMDLAAGPIHGMSPIVWEHDPNDDSLKTIKGWKYITFPMTDIGKLKLKAEYNIPFGSEEKTEGIFTVNVREAEVDSNAAYISYFFDYDFHLLGVDPNDIYRKLRRTTPALDEISDWDAYLDNIRDSVSYWTDSGLVTEGQLRAASASH